jgi:hypothetical protein
MLWCNAASVLSRTVIQSTFTAVNYTHKLLIALASYDELSLVDTERVPLRKGLLDISVFFQNLKTFLLHNETKHFEKYKHLLLYQ